MSKEEIEELAFQHCEKYVSLVAKNIVYHGGNHVKDFIEKINNIYPKYFITKNRKGSYIVLDYFLMCESLKEFDNVVEQMIKNDPGIYEEYNSSGNVMFGYYLEFFRQKIILERKNPFPKAIPFNTKFLQQFNKKILTHHISIEKIFKHVVNYCSHEELKELFVFYKSIDKEFLKYLEKDIKLINWKKSWFSGFSKEYINEKIDIILDQLKDMYQHVLVKKTQEACRCKETCCCKEECCCEEPCYCENTCLCKEECCCEELSEKIVLKLLKI